MRATFVLDGRRLALYRRDLGADAAPVYHGDCGVRYASVDYAQTLDDHGCSLPWAQSATPRPSSTASDGADRRSGLE